MRWQLFSDHEQEADDVQGDAVTDLHDSDAAFWASPVGRAARARLRGDRFFQIELDDATLAAYAETAAPAEGRRARRTCDLLGQIEELGWHLEHVSWWRVDGHDAGGDRPFEQPASDEDHVRGVYLFHSVPVDDTTGQAVTAESVGAGHTPSHRREVS